MVRSFWGSSQGISGELLRRSGCSVLGQGLGNGPGLDPQTLHLNAEIFLLLCLGMYLEDHGYKSPKWGYPNYNLLITLLTKSHEPLSRRLFSALRPKLSGANRTGECERFPVHTWGFEL